MEQQKTEQDGASLNSGSINGDAGEISENSQACLSSEEIMDPEKFKLDLEQLLKAGVHFGHKKARWNPKAKKFIFGLRNGVHIIDLEKTEKYLKKALDFVGQIAAANGLIVFVGTKKQAKNLIKCAAEIAQMPYVNERWLGGTFTNFEIMKKRLKYLVESGEALEKGKLGELTKLEKHRLRKKVEKIGEKMGGLIGMTRIPDAVFVLDIIKDEAAVKEAKKLKIKTVGLIDSNGDPEAVDYPIPANDDALSSIKYILGLMAKKILESKNKPNETSENMVSTSK